MEKLCIFAGTITGSYAFWFLGDGLFGLGFGWAFALSGLGSLVGVYCGWKIAQRFK